MSWAQRDAERQEDEAAARDAAAVVLELSREDADVVLHALKVYAAGYCPRVVRELTNDARSDERRRRSGLALRARADAWKRHADRADALVQAILRGAPKGTRVPEFPPRPFSRGGRRT